MRTRTISLRRLAPLVVAALAACGGSRATPRRAATNDDVWLNGDRAPDADGPSAKVEPAQYALVKKSGIQEALGQLERVPVVAIDEAAAARLTGAPRPADDEALAPYLVRLVCLIGCSPESYNPRDLQYIELWSHGSFLTAEHLTMGHSPAPLARGALVVWLPAQPRTIYLRVRLMG